MHLVGSYPGTTTRAALDEVLRVVGPHLATVPSSETGTRSDGVFAHARALRDHPALEIRHDGNWTDYDDRLTLAVRRGHTLRAGDLDLDLSTAHAATVAAWQQLRHRRKIAELPVQVSVPGATDLALFAMGTIGMATQRRIFAEAAATEIATIHASAGADAVFQLELPAIPSMIARSSRMLRPALVEWAARSVARQAAMTPVGTRIGIHLCLGDLAHQSLAVLPTAAPLVAFVNALVRRWPARQRLEYVHVPFTGGPHPPSQRWTFYEPLARLRLPTGTRFAAGILHERASVTEVREAVKMIEYALGCIVDVGPPCGLGRLSPLDSRRILMQGATLCSESDG